MVEEKKEGPTLQDKLLKISNNFKKVWDFVSTKESGPMIYGIGFLGALMAAFLPYSITMMVGGIVFVGAIMHYEHFYGKKKKKVNKRTKKKNGGSSKGNE